MATGRTCDAGDSGVRQRYSAKIYLACMLDTGLSGFSCENAVGAQNEQQVTTYRYMFSFQAVRCSTAYDFMCQCGTLLKNETPFLVKRGEKMERSETRDVNKKTAFRAHMAKLRDKLGEEERKTKSELICRRIREHPLIAHWFEHSEQKERSPV